MLHKPFSAAKFAPLALLILSRFGEGEVFAAPKRDSRLTLLEGSACSQSPSRSPQKQACSPAARGAGLSGEVVAGSEGATLLLDGARLALGPGTALELEAPSQALDGSGQRRPVSTVSLLRGRLLVSPGAERRFVRVRGRGSASAMTDGWAMFQRTERTLAVTNMAGFLWVGSGSGSSVPVGKSKAILRDGAPLLGHRAQEAPRLEESRRVAIDALQQQEPLEVRWAQAPGATGYLVRLRGESGDLLRCVAVEPSRQSAALAGLSPGDYSVSVATLDEVGLPGRESAPMAVSLIGLKLPAGAMLGAEREVQMPGGRALELSNTSRVELAEEGSSIFGAVPREIFFLGKGRPLWLRHREGGAVASLTLIERTARAEVSMSPRDAQWPRDPVQIRVALQGLPAGASLRAVSRVTLGVSPVDVQWRKEGAAWIATVPPSPISTYQVLRVEVSDEHGVFLGRSFLELKPSEP